MRPERRALEAAGRTARRAAGFTRIELLAVLCGVCLLGLAARGVLAESRQDVGSAVCLSNLRTLMQGWLMYATDQEGWFPPNPTDGNRTPGHNWCIGQAGPYSDSQFNPDFLTDPAQAMLVPYTGPKEEIYRCGADTRTGAYQGADPARQGSVVPAARSYAMNQAVGTNPYSKAGKIAVDGAWLDNNHNHTVGRTWRTYGKLADLTAPTPSRLLVLWDEDAYSINDASFGFGMVRPEWIDWPSTRHDFGGTVAYADGSAELHHWIARSTGVINGKVSRRSVPDSPDHAWLSERISARIAPAE
ncbi:MAG: hypothetical protein H7A46_16460 [Verrucomicrobiales bacterium]|nr:hypothetical protein [Verrucomicrobiales bacterium]